MGEPVLIGRHSETRHRRALDRSWNAMGKACGLTDLAKHHQSKAAGLAVALDKTIFSDDSDAPEALAERIAANEAKRDRMKEINALYRKGDAVGLAALGLYLESLQAKLKDAYSWMQKPHPSYELTNLGARIRTDKERLEQIKGQQERKASAEESPNGVTREDCSGGYVRITFAEKPERAILDAMKASGFRWSAGSWAGKADQLPAVVSEMLQQPPAEPTDYLQQAIDAQAEQHAIIEWIMPEAAEYSEAMEVQDAEKANRAIKTLEQWNKSGQALDDFLQIGDAVDDEMANYFVGVLPPACMTGHVVQIGEPVSDVDGRPTYATLHRAYVGMPWVYAGNCHRGQFTVAA
jgi:hypothetical protein